MTDDIVFRLRGIITWGQMGVVLEAADEIERLRRENAELLELWQKEAKDNRRCTMTDDIVTRLRQQVCECGYSASFDELHKCLNCEAADEIERLRDKDKEPTIVPKHHMLVLKQPAGQSPFMASELAEISNGIKKNTGIEVLLLSGWDVVGFMEKSND